MVEAIGGQGARRFADIPIRSTSARRYVDASSLQLTAQEQQIAQLVKQGLSNREIGNRLFLSPRTIEGHLGAPSRGRALEDSMDGGVVRSIVDRSQ